MIWNQEDFGWYYDDGYIWSPVKDAFVSKSQTSTHTILKTHCRLVHLGSKEVWHCVSYNFKSLAPKPASSSKISRQDRSIRKDPAFAEFDSNATASQWSILYMPSTMEFLFQDRVNEPKFTKPLLDDLKGKQEGMRKATEKELMKPISIAGSKRGREEGLEGPNKRNRIDGGESQIQTIPEDSLLDFDMDGFASSSTLGNTAAWVNTLGIATLPTPVSSVSGLGMGPEQSIGAPSGLTVGLDQPTPSKRNSIADLLNPIDTSMLNLPLDTSSSTFGFGTSEGFSDFDFLQTSAFAPLLSDPPGHPVNYLVPPTEGADSRRASIVSVATLRAKDKSKSNTPHAQAFSPRQIEQIFAQPIISLSSPAPAPPAASPQAILEPNGVSPTSRPPHPLSNVLPLPQGASDPFPSTTAGFSLPDLPLPDLFRDEPLHAPVHPGPSDFSTATGLTPFLQPASYAPPSTNSRPTPPAVADLAHSNSILPPATHNSPQRESRPTPPPSAGDYPL
ncbi:hypothetical protein BT69DRAFT_395773 [Atractiella rhizophila]|nr:hypothetical protein BT69DRAFT_395773 [Atractiella rhizophila]